VRGGSASRDWLANCSMRSLSYSCLTIYRPFATTFVPVSAKGVEKWLLGAQFLPFVGSLFTYSMLTVPCP
jgi:hypothetical protein